MSEEWGPWIEHDGSGCPAWLAGITIEIEAEYHSGGLVREIGSFSANTLAFQKHWDWSNFGKPSSFGWAWARVLRYRIRRPKALRELIERVESLPAPERIREGVA